MYFTNFNHLKHYKRMQKLHDIVGDAIALRNNSQINLSLSDHSFIEVCKEQSDWSGTYHKIMKRVLYYSQGKIEIFNDFLIKYKLVKNETIVSYFLLVADNYFYRDHYNNLIILP